MVNLLRLSVPLTLLSAAFSVQFAYALPCNDNFTAIDTIQGTTDASPLAGQQVSTRGVVTAQLYPGTKMAGVMLRATNRAVSGASSSLFIADAKAAEQYQPGQQLQISGTVTELKHFTSLTDISSITLCETTADVTPLTVKLPLAQLSDWE